MKNAKITSIFIICSLSIMLFYGYNSTAKKAPINTKIVPMNNKTADGFIPALYGNQSMQSLIYIPEDDVIISGYKLYSGTEGLCTLRKWNRKTKKLITNYDNLNLYHCSDMTYNPNTKEIFISTNTDPRARNYISVYDYTTMTFKREFQYIYKSIVYGIAYSTLHNQFVFYDNSNIRICDSNMVSQSFFNVPNLGMNYQSIEVYKNYVYIYYDVAIQIYDFQGNYIKTYKIDTLDEGEGICYVGYGKFLVGRVINTPMATASATSRVYIFDTSLMGACRNFLGRYFTSA